MNIFKRKLVKRTALFGVGAREFNCAVDYARLILGGDLSREEQIALLDFMLDVVREDLKTDLLSAIFYGKERLKTATQFPFPYRYYDETGAELVLRPKGKRTVDLATDCVLVLPWDKQRMKKSIMTVFRNDFEFDRRNHITEYYSHVDLCYVRNCKHTIASGIGHKKGSIQAEEYDVSRLFEHVSTDGGYWYNSHNNQKLGTVFDFRVGIIYEIARMKHQIGQ